MSEQQSSGNGYRIGIALCDFILFGFIVWSIANYAIILEYIKRTGNDTGIETAIIWGLVMACLIALLIFICFWGVLAKNKAYVKWNKILYIVYAVLAVAAAVLGFLSNQFVAGGVQIAWVAFAIFAAVLCSRYYHILAKQDQTHSTNKV